jgi:hypothetical protein
MKGLAWLDRDSKHGHFYTYEARFEQGLKKTVLEGLGRWNCLSRRG